MSENVTLLLFLHDILGLELSVGSIQNCLLESARALEPVEEQLVQDKFSKSYSHKNAHRTSNMVDRLMKFFDRACFDAQYFHGTLASGKQRVRAWVVLWITINAMRITGWKIC